MTVQARVRGSLPWTGTRAAGAVQRQDDPRGTQRWHGPLAEAIARRGEDRHQALADRLAELRADPPRGYPR